MTDLVIAKAFHALRHHYGVPETAAVGRLREFLGSGIAHVDPVGEQAALGPEASGRTGVVDRLIVARHRTLGATIATFDRQQARLEGGVLLRM